MDPYDLRAGTLEEREERLYRLLDRVRDHDDQVAAEAVRRMVRDYPDYHRTVYTRAMNQAGLFVDETCREALLRALSDTRYNCQAWAAMGCAAGGWSEAVPALTGLLGHADWNVRAQAVIALGRLGDDTLVPVLAGLLGEPEQWMRQHAADALADIGGPAALEALWREFTDRRFTRIGYIASNLARFTPQVLPRLEAATADPDPDRRYWAAVALGSTGEETAAPTLERLMATDRGSTVFDGRVDVAAKKALRTLRRIQAAVAARG